MIPLNLRAGDTWTWDDDAPLLPFSTSLYATNSDFVQHYGFHGPVNFILPSASASSGTGFTTEETAEDSTEHPEGTYLVQRYVTRGAERYTIGESSIRILKNIAGTQGSFDARSFVRKSLDTIEATIAANLGKPMETQKSAVQEIGYRSWAEMMAVRSTLKLEVKSEDDAAALSVGLPGRRMLRIRNGAVSS